MRKFAAQHGFVTIAQNTNDVDYLNLAYIQAQNIKKTQKNSQYAVIVDTETFKLVSEQHRSVFDHVIVLPVDYAKNDQWKLQNEWQVFNLTPFKETIKLESDLLFTRDIGHWQQALRLKDICFSLHCQDYLGNIVTNSPYRRIFVDNQLPDIYNGMYYFRYSQTAADFFKTAQSIYANWSTVTSQLVRCDDQPTTDVVFALAAKILGVEQCTIPSIDFFNFVHMKPKIQMWNDSQSWLEYVNVERDNNMLRINNINQYSPVHYHEKNFNDIK
jgi:hypothetical protein